VQLELTEDQSRTFHGLKTDAEKEQFVKAFAMDHQAEINERLGAAMRERAAQNDDSGTSFKQRLNRHKEKQLAQQVKNKLMSEEDDGYVTWTE
jgi:hypothetical protein